MLLYILLTYLIVAVVVFFVSLFCIAKTGFWEVDKEALILAAITGILWLPVAMFVLALRVWGPKRQ